MSFLFDIVLWLSDQIIYVMKCISCCSRKLQWLNVVPVCTLILQCGWMHFLPSVYQYQAIICYVSVWI